MTIRDLSYWTIVKLTLFITMLIPLIFVLALVPFVLLDVPNVTLSATSDEVPLVLGVLGLKMPGLPTWIPVLVVGVLNLLVSSKALQLLARFTPLGNIKISTAKPTRI